MNIDIAKLGYRWKGIYSQFLAYTDNDVVYMNGGAYVIKNGLPTSFALGQQMATSIVDRVFKTTLASGLSYGPSKGLSKNDRVKETQGAFG